MASTYHRLLEEGVALQPSLRYAPVEEVRWTDCERVPRVVVIPKWSRNAPLTKDALAALVPHKWTLPDELVELYTTTGDGFRSPGVELPAAARLLASWVKARGARSARPRILVPIDDEPYASAYLIGFVGQRSDVWLSPDGISDDFRTRKIFPSVGAWLDDVVARGLEESRAELAQFHALEAQLAPADLSGVATPKELLDYLRPAVAAAPFPSLRQLAWARFATAVAGAAPHQLDRDNAGTIFWWLFERCGWAHAGTGWSLASTFGEKVQHLFAPTGEKTAQFRALLGLAHLHQGHREAIAHLAAAIELGARTRACDLARAYMAVGEIDEAEHRVDAAAKDDSYIQTYLGEIKLRANKLDEAEAALKNAIVLIQRPGNPFMGDAYYFLGELYLRQGRLDEAEEVLKMMAARPRYYHMLAEIFDKRGEVENARLARERGEELTQRGG